MPFRKPSSWERIKPPVGPAVDWGDPINNALYACWLFNEGGSNNVKNLCSSNGVGTLTNGPVWSVGKFGKTISFDGTDDTIAIANESYFDFERTQPLTIVAWFYPNNVTDVVHAIISKIDNVSPNSGWGFICFNGVGASDALYFSEINTVTTNELSVRTTAGTIVTSAWQQAAVTYDGSSTPGGCHLFANGVSKAVTTVVNTLSASVLNNITPYVGSRNALGQRFSGKIDHVRIWKRKLLDQEIAYLYANPFAGITVPRRRIISQGAVAAGRIARYPDLSGLGGVGQQAFNPNLGI